VAALNWIKNPPEGWVFHVAHRRYLEYVVQTSTNEIIDESNDFRILDLDFPLVNSQPDSKITRERFYKKIIQYEVRGLDSEGDQFDYKKFSPHTLLPSAKSELAENLREDTYAKDAWKRLTEYACNLVGLDPQKIIEKGNSLENSKLWVLWPIIVARRKSEILNQLDLKSYFHNHFIGAVLQIYFESKGRAPMEYYCGFSELCSIVLSNVREFILILQQAIEYEHQNDEKMDFIEIMRRGLSSTSQYKAVLARSKHFNDVVAISAAERGLDIETALNNWFKFFSVCQRLPTLPYNEPNHIICSDSIDESSSAWKTIEAGEKHGAFLFTQSSKQRERTKDNQKDIRIHPLLAAKHYLSYSKRNTPSLEFKTISLITTTTDLEKVKMIASQRGKIGKVSIYRQGTLF
jgi:hypothetical protein